MNARSFGSGSGKGQRRLAMETLERRTMLAGNVDVFVAGGNLIVRGDNQDNLILIQQVDDGEYTVTGFDFADGEFGGSFESGPTNIRGGSDQGFGTKLFTGVTGNIDVDLKKGDDGIGIGNSVEDLAVIAEDCGFGFAFGSGSGGGNGTFSGTPAQIDQPEIDGDKLLVRRDLIIQTGDGLDGVIVDADVRRNAIILTGNGNDVVGIGAASLEHLDHAVIGDDLVVNTGKGDDVLCVHSLLVRDQLVADMGDGNDSVTGEGFEAGGITVVTANGNDLIDFANFATDRQVVVNAGNGNNDVFMDNFSAGGGEGPRELRGAGNVVVTTGSGSDNVELTNFDANSVVISTGAGNDGTPSDESPITVLNAEIFTDRDGNFEFDSGEPAGPLTIVTGAGNDLVEVVGIDAGSITIDTGAGNDGTSDFPIRVDDFNVVRALVLVTGAGNDNAAIEDGDLDDLIVNLGAGNDFLNLLDLDVDDDATIDAGAGNDEVSSEGVNVDDLALILMGAGNDTLSIFGSSGRRLRAFGGRNTDTFNNDLGVESNGDDGDVEAREFENFNFG